jgi:hypothetical protein
MSQKRQLRVRFGHNFHQQVDSLGGEITMKVLESSCAVLKCVPSRPSDADSSDQYSTSSPEPLKFEVGVSLSICRDAVGDGQTEHVDLSTIVRSAGPFADRESVKLSAVRQLPDLLRELAEELEKKHLVDSGVTPA